jgi:hypothetical protein
VRHKEDGSYSGEERGGAGFDVMGDNPVGANRRVKLSKFERDSGVEGDLAP